MTQLNYDAFAQSYPEATLKLLRWAAEQGFDIEQVLDFRFDVYTDKLCAHTPTKDGDLISEYDFKQREWDYEPHY